MDGVGGKINFYDTNILLGNLKYVEDNGFFYVSSVTLKELESIKTSGRKDEQVKYEARKASRYLLENENNYKVIVVEKKHHDFLQQLDLEEDNDNLIMACAVLLKDKVVFYSNDICCYNLGKNIFKLDVHKLDKNIKDNYKGYIEKSFSDEELVNLYSNLSINTYNLLENEYLVVKNKNNEVVDKMKWTGTKLEPLKYKTISTKYTDKVKPKNIKQEFAFDMLQNPKIKLSVLEGYHGTGKTLLMIANALELIEKGKYSKIIWVVQNEPVDNYKDIGALPGQLSDKLLPFTSILADKIGGQFSMEEMISNRKLEIIPLAFIRGRSFKDAIVMMTEAENTTVQHMKLLISRLEENSMLMIDGDYKQTDNKVFKSNNGLRKVVDTFKGIPEFGVMTLTDVERSRLANLANLLD